jgi:hypothetical protein
MRFDQLLVSGFGGVVIAHPDAERANTSRQITHGSRYATCSEQDQDDDKHDQPVRETERSHDRGSRRRTHECQDRTAVAGRTVSDGSSAGLQEGGPVGVRAVPTELR